MVARLGIFRSQRPAGLTLSHGLVPAYSRYRKSGVTARQWPNTVKSAELARF